MKFFRLNLIAGLLGIGLLITPLTQAQDKSTTVNITGCLAQGPRAHEYSMKDANGQTYGLVPARNLAMKRHVGQEVMVTGNVIKARREIRRDNAAGATADNEYLRVNQVKRVSSTCS